MSDTISPQRGFKGIWIPKEIWLDEDLSIQEKVLLAEIDSLDCSDNHCFASDDYFMKFMDCSKSQLKRYLKNLRDKGYITTTGFDGKVRTMTSNLKEMVYGKRASSDVSHQVAQKRASSTLTSEPHITKGIKKNKKESVVEDPVGSPTSRHSKISFLSKDGETETIDESYFYQQLAKNRFDWSGEEIAYAKDVLAKYKGIVYDWLKFLGGAVDNFRKSKKSKNITKHGDKLWKEKKKSKQSNDNCSETNTSERPLQKLVCLGPLLGM